MLGLVQKEIIVMYFFVCRKNNKSKQNKATKEFGFRQSSFKKTQAFKTEIEIISDIIYDMILKFKPYENLRALLFSDKIKASKIICVQNAAIIIFKIVCIFRIFKNKYFEILCS